MGNCGSHLPVAAMLVLAFFPKVTAHAAMEPKSLVRVVEQKGCVVRLKGKGFSIGAKYALFAEASGTQRELLAEAEVLRTNATSQAIAKVTQGACENLTGLFAEEMTLVGSSGAKSESTVGSFSLTAAMETELLQKKGLGSPLATPDSGSVWAYGGRLAMDYLPRFLASKGRTFGLGADAAYHKVVPSTKIYVRNNVVGNSDFETAEFFASAIAKFSFFSEQLFLEFRPGYFYRAVSSTFRGDDPEAVQPFVRLKTSGFAMETRIPVRLGAWGFSLGAVLPLFAGGKVGSDGGSDYPLKSVSGYGCEGSVEWNGDRFGVLLGSRYFSMGGNGRLADKQEYSFSDDSVVIHLGLRFGFH